MVVERIEREIVIDASQERVWAALTEAEQIRKWLGDPGPTVDIRPGGEILLSWVGCEPTRAIIEKVEPHTFLSWRWGGPLGPDPVEGNSTLVEFSLTPDGSGTRLSMVESGFPSLDAPEEEQEKYLASNIRGWQSEFEDLRKHLAE